MVRRKAVCDACDGRHKTANCPQYPMPRDEHPDAHARCGGLGLHGPSESAGSSHTSSHILADGVVTPMPKDGSCIFHSLLHGKPDSAPDAAGLRLDLAKWVAENPIALIDGT